MHISSLNAMFCTNVPYVSQWPNKFLLGICSLFSGSVKHTCILLHSAAFTVLVLLVCKCGELFSTSRQAESNNDETISCVLTCVPKMTSFQFIQSSIDEVYVVQYMTRFRLHNSSVLTYCMFKYDGETLQTHCNTLPVYTESKPATF